MFGFFNHGLGPLANFEANYRAYPVSFIDKLDAENGDKVFLPPSALDRLSSMNVEYPMLFNVTNRQTARDTHCGVLEFIAEEGVIYMPYWMMQNLVLQEGDVVKVRNVSLPKGTYVKLQPHTTDFINISNPKAVLETTLRGYTCLTVGDAICVYYNNRKYFIDVVEAKPAPAISVIDTDCEVDFAQPLDYVEPVREPPKPVSTPAADAAGPSTSAAEPQEPEEPKFLAFAGSGRRLDGKTPKHEAQPVAVPLNQYKGGWRTAAETSAATVGGPETDAKAAPAAGAAADGKRTGKVVFGGGNRLTAKKDKPKPPPKPKEEDQKDEDSSRFTAFGGKPNKLR
jgi:ubiquitin fusion degradation protein 1